MLTVYSACLIGFVPEMEALQLAKGRKAREVGHSPGRSPFDCSFLHFPDYGKIRHHRFKYQALCSGQVCDFPCGEVAAPGSISFIL